MTSAASPLNPPLRDSELRFGDLTDFFKPKDPACERVGLELEKFGTLDGSGRPLPVSGDRSVQSILEALERAYGWEAERDGGAIIALRRGDEMVSVEPGGQLELSTPPAVTLDAAQASEAQHLKELSAITGGWGVTWWAAGVRASCSLDEVGWIPKRRYNIMKKYLAEKGELAHWMMKMTASLQVSVDYRSEGDAAQKLGVAARLVPVLTAICAASPIVQGRPIGFKSYRSHIWTKTDPDRCGLPECFFKENFSFADYVDYALAIPLFFIERDGEYVPTSGLSFRQFMKEGFGGHRARPEDWAKHLTFLFPEIRLKNYIEIRCCDRLPGSLSFSVAALIKAILYSPETLSEARAWLRELTVSQTRLGLAQAAQKGFEGMMGGRPLLTWAGEAVKLGRKGLERLRAAGRSSQLELTGYQNLEQMVLEDRVTLADRMLAAWHQGSPLEPLVRL